MGRTLLSHRIFQLLVLILLTWQFKFYRKQIVKFIFYFIMRTLWALSHWTQFICSVHTRWYPPPHVATTWSCSNSVCLALNLRPRQRCKILIRIFSLSSYGIQVSLAFRLANPQLVWRVSLQPTVTGTHHSELQPGISAHSLPAEWLTFKCF